MISIDKINSDKLCSGIRDLAPIECMNCEFDGYIPIHYYLVNGQINSEQDYLELKQIVIKQLGYNSFDEASSELGHLISVSRCPKCTSEEIFSDY